MNDLEQLLPALVSKDSLAPSFDAAFYGLVQSDLAHLDEAGLRLHYENHGRLEGRLASPAAHRAGFLAQIPVVGLTLEIGPAVRPVLRGEQLRYFDIADKAGLTARALAEGYDPAQCPEIHYVSPVGDLGVVQAIFQGVFSSHCIEHSPDLITHLQSVARLLEPNGRYYLIVPDKRYCFDALLPESTLEEVLEAHRAQRRVHTIRKVIEHHALTTHNDAARHWRGDSADSRAGEAGERTRVALDLFDSSQGGYIDVHAWQFTPASFHAIVQDIAPTSGLEVERVYDTMFGRPEFCAVLRRHG